MLCRGENKNASCKRGENDKTEIIRGTHIRRQLYVHGGKLRRKEHTPRCGVSLEQTARITQLPVKEIKRL